MEEENEIIENNENNNYQTIEITPIPDILVSNNNNSNDFTDDDLEVILQQYLKSETDIDLLTDKLSKQLSDLESGMVVDILDSGLGVSEIISQLGDKDQTHLTGVTAWIEYYNNQLQNMKKYIEHIESKNNKMEVVSRNQRSLLQELNNLLNLLTLDEKTTKALTSPEFNTPTGLETAIKAANDLKKALTTKLKSGMDNMVAVKDQRKAFEGYRVTFSLKVSKLIESAFKVSDANRDYQVKSTDEDLPEHTGFFNLLNTFRPLVHWLKELDPEKFQPLIPLYIKAYRNTYKSEIKDYFSKINHTLIKESKDQNDFFHSAKLKPVSTVNDITSSSSSTISANATGKKKRTIEKLFRYALSCLEQSIMSEQKFLLAFFLWKDPPKKKHHSDSNSNNNNATVHGSNIGGLIQEPLDVILSEMFESVIPELVEIVEKADQINPFYLLITLVDTEEYISGHSQVGNEEYSSYLQKVLAEVQKTMKSLFNKFIDLQVDSIKATQISLKKCGVLSHFKNFPLFVKEIEKYRPKTEMESISSLIYSSYFKLIVCLYNWIDQLADKLPSSDAKYKFIAKLENYYYLSTKFDELKIDAIRQYRDTSTNRYQENLTTYINYLLSLKFQPLLDFYQEIDEFLKTLPPSDIQFQKTHTKQQFKKMVEKYKTENIESGLTKALLNIYKKITKDSPLILVIWLQLEDVFIDKYDHFQEITQKCYEQTIPVSSDQIKSIFQSVYKKNPNKHK
ncbi:exocyst complex subunit 1 [Tieghemostelium lacteum]|uniref:Exocyst complex subunit 1 n=1 Tax=Tieghemostelium lacteum TaxID=361077 RepID=A0A152A6Q5_TIELA|nr:exocyst complex subunit 1 [Tieghemostelium lacteum]|eukprot:KYR01910.1 exocyst complex subunit 1 [Tieghemostelium lacteum]